jgi:hypothetical protein
MALGFEDPSCCLSREESAIKVDSHDLAPLLGGAVLGRIVVSDAAVGYNDIEPAKVFCDLLDSRLDDLGISYIRLICCGLDGVGTGNVSSSGCCVFRRAVDYRDL